MTSSDEWFGSDALLASLLNALAEERLAAAIDEPVDQVMHNRSQRLRPARTVRQLHRVLGETYRRLGRVVPPYRRLTREQATEEAIWLLQNDPEAPGYSGYDAARAMLAESPEEGLIAVITRLGELLKLQCRRLYRRRVLLALHDPLEWQLQLRLARELRGSLQRFLPRQVAAYSDEQFVHTLEELLDLHMSTQPPSRCSITDAGITAS